MAEKEGKVLKFVWKVVNYSYCWKMTDDFLPSPEFQMDIFEGSSWCLKVYPSGVTSYERYISVHLERLETSGGPFGITVDYEIALLRSDGTVGSVKETKDRCFRKGHAFGFDNLALQEELLGTKKSTFLSDDILTVQCRICPKGTKLKTDTEIIAKTFIELERSVFFWKFAVENDCSVPPYKHYRLPIRNTRYYMTLKIYPCHNDITMGVFEHRNSIRAMHYKVGILDSNHSVSWVVIDKQTKDTTNLCNILQIASDEILKQKSLYVQNNTLTLHCDFSFSFGVQQSHIENIFYEDALTFAPASREISSGINRPPNSSCHCNDGDASFKSDFLNLYQERTLCDFVLKVGNENIQAHKVVLGARSPVFKAMLTSNMKEKEKNWVDISDFDVNTVHCMLKYMYTDLTGDLDWEAARKLYSAADKYGIIKLQRICSRVLERKLCVSNVRELLSLANMHGDHELKNLTIEFISRHETEVICSTEWKTFMTEELNLAAETMHYIFMKKAENNSVKNLKIV